MKKTLAAIPIVQPQAQEVDWQDVYTRCLPRVFHFFCYKVGDSDLAEELTAITFEKAWKSRGHYNPSRGLVEAWLLGIARNVACDHFRTRARATLFEAGNLAMAAAHPGDDLQRRLDFQAILTVLSHLPEREQDLVAMKYGAEMTNREIAHLTGLSESNVGTILYRAVEKIRAEWEKSDGR